MAYTYDQFITAATGAGILDKFTDDDLNIAKNNPEYGMSALKLQQDLLGAKTTEQKLLAQESLNQLRKSYGDVVASSAAPTTQNTANPAGSFSYGNETIYQQMLKDVTNPKPFEYDVNQDPSFQSMKKSYLREGDRAREDTMASFSAMTGGVPSSAAITAAQQAGDYYATQLNDSIPTLQQNAYQRYLAELDAKQAALGTIITDRNFDWQKYLQEYDQQQNQIQLDEAKKQQEWNNAFALYQQLGYATPEIAAILGIESNVPQKNVYYGSAPGEETTSLPGKKNDEAKMDLYDQALGTVHKDKTDYLMLLGAVSTAKSEYSGKGTAEKENAYKEAVAAINDYYRKGKITAAQRTELINVAAVVPNPR